MVSLPGLIFYSVLLKTCLSVDDVKAPIETGQLLKCPGRCETGGNCATTLNETDCANGFECCVDHLERISTTEFADLEFTTQDSLDAAASEMELEAEESGTEGYTVSPDPTEDGYTYVYSEESETFMLDPNEKERDTREDCPGTCVPFRLGENCEYLITEARCPGDMACCLTAQDVMETSHQFNYELEDEPSTLARRSSELDIDETCPGTCVHPSHAMFCEEILDDYPCPLNAKCCVKRLTERSLASSIDCTGQCLPVNMQGYCFPPNELVLGPTNCARGTTCCMRRPSDGVMHPPTVNRMNFPSIPTRNQNYDAAQVVLGHLAVDDAGTVYKVNTAGQIFPLPRLTPMDHVGRKFTKLTAFPRVDGEIGVYSDATGNLYQHFYSRQTETAFLPQYRPESPLVRQPIYQFASQASEQNVNVEGQEESADEVADVLEDIVIPDDDDEVPVTTSSPVVRDNKASRPACPGSCMSYFLRFTCFRGYAIYDGFTCPGRSVCCALLKDIEEHELYLKSLSPYFNAPPVPKESTLPRCGMKGRRDTPRIIGGKEALPGEWCWQVAILNVQNQYICGGALIDNSWILTAAHCIVGSTKENQAIFVRAGVTDLKSLEDNNNGQTARVLSTFIHHNFNSLNLDNNIALLRLQKPIELGHNSCVICLPTSGQMPKDSTKCTVTGYGFISPDGDMSLKVTEARIPIVDDMDCMTNITEALTNPFILPASSFCAGGQGKQDACQGDAGGPLACEVGGYHELVGLVSWGLGCGRDDVPSIYVKVPTFMGWINQIIGSSSFLMSLN